MVLGVLVVVVARWCGWRIQPPTQRDTKVLCNLKLSAIYFIYAYTPTFSNSASGRRCSPSRPCAARCAKPSIVSAHRDGRTSPSHGLVQIGASCDCDRSCCSRQLLRFRSQRATSSKLVSTRDTSSVPVLVGASLGQALLVMRPRRLWGGG